MYAGHEADVEAEMTFRHTEDGGRETPVKSGYRPQFFFQGEDHDAVHPYVDVESVSPGETVKAHLHFLHPELLQNRLRSGDSFEIREGNRVVALGRITQLLRLKSTLGSD